LNINDIYEDLIKQPFGTDFIKSDLHLHFAPPTTDNDNIKNYCEKLYDVLKRHEIWLIALTVHRQQDLEVLFKGIEIIKNLCHEGSYDITIFPSIEIRDSSNTHFAIIFNKNLTLTEIGNFMGAIGRKKEQENINEREKSDLIDKNLSGDQIELGKKFSDYSVIGLFPHPLINDGIAKKISGESLENYVENPLTYLWNLGNPHKDLNESLKSKDCPVIFTSTPLKYEDKDQFKRLARIKVSDGHDPDKLDEIYTHCPLCSLYEYCNVGYSYLKLANRNIKAIKQIEYDHKTRVKFNIENIRSHAFLEGMYIKSNFFKEELFSFNPELNVLIGGRGTGKSLLIDLIRFSCNSIPHDQEYLKIFNSKLIKQLGNEGTVILFYKDNEGNTWAFENVLLIEENAKEIDWDENVNIVVYKKYEDLPFLEEENNNIDLIIKIEALSQTEIPRIHQKTDSLLEIIDAYIIEFHEKIERFKLIENLDKLKLDIQKKYKKYRDINKKLEDLNKNKEKLEENKKYLAKIQNLKVDRYQKLISIDSILEDEKLLISQWFENLTNVLELNIEGKILSELPSEFKLELKEIIDIYKEMNKKLTQFQDTAKKMNVEYKNEYENNFNTIIEKWRLFYEPKYNEFKEILDQHDKGFIEKIQQKVMKLEKGISELEKKVEILPTLTESIESLELKIIEIGKKIFNKSIEIDVKRKRIAKEIVKKLKENGINARINIRRNKKIKDSDYYDWLYKIHKAKSDILRKIYNKYLPYELANAIINDKLSKISKNFPKNQGRIFNKLSVLVESSKALKIFNPMLIELMKFYIDNRPIISYKRDNWKRFHPLNRISIGERCAILLYIMLLVENLPFMVDQADSELDQESTQKFSEYLLQIKESRQIIVATHNPNIPTLGDVDLLYHLDTEPSGDREIGKILSRGGFEDTIEAILRLEGGREAIKRRFKKYNEKLFD